MRREPTRARFLWSTALLATVVFGSGAVFWTLEGTAYSLFDSIYFALITVSTVGYSCRGWTCTRARGSSSSS